MKGIILAGGEGSRLYPSTKIINKHIFPVYDKPMIYYPLSLLMLGGIREILIISKEEDQKEFKTLFDSGQSLGLTISYATQDNPNGIPEAFIIAEQFIGKDNCSLILGDNIFYGDINFFRESVKKIDEGKSKKKSIVFAYNVSDPYRYGVIDFNQETGEVKSIEEKPENPKSNFAIPGLYIFDSSVCQKASELQVSPRGETEITDIIKNYQQEGTLGVRRIERGVAWLDAGTPKALVEASSYIAAIEERQGLKVACLEEVAYRMGFIFKDDLQKILETYPLSPYRSYIEMICLS